MADGIFELQAPYTATGDQPRAIAELIAAFEAGKRRCTLLGVTGSGKTFTMANLIARLQQPTLILSHNKTLAAQLYSEFKGFFPHNAVEYFVSYYDYYQPEAYIPGKDLYIEKDAAINEEIDKLRLSATRSLLSRRDVIIVASVSSIYGLGSPQAYQDLTVSVAVGEHRERDALLRDLVAIQYTRGDLDFSRGRFRVRGDVIEIWPAYEDTVVRIELFGEEIDAIATVHALSGEVLGRHQHLDLYPAKHFVVDEPTLEHALVEIEHDLAARLHELQTQGALLESQRLQSRTEYDLEMMREVGYCSGIENYARYFSGRKPGQRPFCLLDYFPPGFLAFVDESHVTLPQLRGMFAGDRSRKETLVEHGFRLPSALDNRPMSFAEWERAVDRVLYVSATPGPYEAEHEEARSEQLIRPTGLVDPPIEIRPVAGQVEDLIREVGERGTRGERVLITTVTKRLAEDLSEYMDEAEVPSTYLHSELDALERIETINRLRSGEVHCLVGVNLLREGLDLPEVSLVAILDADKQGFLRSSQSLIQTMGRAARNVSGSVILYADEESEAMHRAIAECRRRREYQMAYNREHDITPVNAVRRDDRDDFREYIEAAGKVAEGDEDYGTGNVDELRSHMLQAAEDLEFEEAARLRDQIRSIETGDDGGRSRRPRGSGKRRGRRGKRP